MYACMYVCMYACMCASCNGIDSVDNGPPQMDLDGTRRQSSSALLAFGSGWAVHAPPARPLCNFSGCRERLQGLDNILVELQVLHARHCIGRQTPLLNPYLGRKKVKQRSIRLFYYISFSPYYFLYTSISAVVASPFLSLSSLSPLERQLPRPGSALNSTGKLESH